MRGVIKSKSDKQFAFVRDSTGVERFFHYTGVAAGFSFDDLAIGQRVEFTEEEGPKGPRARDVRPVANGA